MRPVNIKVEGSVYQRPGRDAEEWETALLLEEGRPLRVLRCALVVQGPEFPVFPAFLLDDWGNEIKGAGLYQWIRDHGNEFPRAEVFGYLHDGQETQHFLREFELYMKYPCFVYAQRRDPVPAGIELQHIFVPIAEAAAETLVAAQPPAAIGSPLRRAAVQWWHVDPAALTGLGWTLKEDLAESNGQD